MNRLHGTCAQNMFQCDNGQCIAIHAMCDGLPDCADSSDEIVKYCAASPCTRYAFRCGYGACIPGGRKCDGKIDCVDGSDENQWLCKYTEPIMAATSRPQYVPTSSRPVYQTDSNYNNNQQTSSRPHFTQTPPRPVYQPTLRPEQSHTPSRPNYQTESNYNNRPTTSRPHFTQTPPRPVYDSQSRPTQSRPVHHTSSRPSYSPSVNEEPTSDDLSCRVDNIPDDADAYYMNKTINYGTYVPNYSRIEYRCIENHSIEGNSTNVCYNGNWRHQKAACRPRCDPHAIDGITILANCFRQEDNREVNVGCRQPLEPGTYATINCRAGYEISEEFHKRVTCGADGRWSPEPGRCTQTCGEQGSIGRPFIVGGYESNIAEVPWHVGLYMKRRATGDFEHICGGSIISAKLIVSAMHCFWDGIENHVHNRRQFQIAVGKSRRGIAEREDYPVQIIAIDKLLYDEAYNHEQSYFVNDIVVAVLEKYIEFKTYVAPVCIKWTLSFEESKVMAGVYGKVAGWGLTKPGGETSPVLKAIEMPTISREECIANSPETFKNFITFDKFCAGYLDGVSVCEGDSGGGLVFPETVGRKTVYYLRGIVSVGVRLQNSCDNFRYATFTNVNKYTDLLKQHFLDYQPKL